MVVALSPRTQAVQYLKYEKPTAVLADTARTILQGLGYHDPVRDQAWGFATTDYLRYLETTDDTPRRYENLRPGQPPAVTFWYRQAPVEMFSDSFLLGGRLQLRVPPITSPGMVAMMLDLKGRLHYLDAVPPRIRDTEETRSKFDWDVALRFAGFDPAKLTPVEPSWVPPGFADARAAWDGVYPDRPEIKVHIEAAAAYGRLVSFQIFEPWSPQTLAPPTAPRPASRRWSSPASSACCSSPLAPSRSVRRNVRLSRGDREGAAHVAATAGHPRHGRRAAHGASVRSASTARSRPCWCSSRGARSSASPPTRSTWRSSPTCAAGRRKRSCRGAVPSTAACAIRSSGATC